MKRPKCRTCPYWHWWENLRSFWSGSESDPIDLDEEEEPLPGITPENTDREDAPCKRRSPQVVTIDRDTITTWPKTWENHWCGEHPDFPAFLASLKEANP